MVAERLFSGLDPRSPPNPSDYAELHEESCAGIKGDSLNCAIYVFMKVTKKNRRETRSVAGKITQFRLSPFCRAENELGEEPGQQNCRKTSRLSPGFMAAVGPN